MRKVLVNKISLLFLLIVVATTVNAQGALIGVKTTSDEVKNGKTASTVTATPSDYRGDDFGIGWNSDSKLLGLNFGFDDKKSELYYFLGANYGLGEINIFGFSVGAGLSKRYVNKGFLIQGKVYPYMGFSSISYNAVDSYNKYGNPVYKTVSDASMTYGLSANIAIGMELWTSIYLTLGYYVSAPEFKFANLFDGGSWGIGLTKIF